LKFREKKMLPLGGGHKFTSKNISRQSSTSLLLLSIQIEERDGSGVSLINKNSSPLMFYTKKIFLLLEIILDGMPDGK